MSFIFKNDELIKSLLKAGDNFQKKYAQVSSTLPTTTLNDAQKKILDAYRLASPMISKLQREIDPSTSQAPSALGDEGSNEIVAKDIRTLGDLLRWAALNKKTWNGERFAWLADDPDRKPDAWSFTAMSDDRSKRGSEEIYADKNKTISFLSMLRDSKQAKENTVFRVMLSKAIGNINDQLKAAGQKTIETKSDNSKRSTLNPESVVDGFTSNVFNSQNPLEDITDAPDFVDSDYKLQVKHLSSSNSFNRWLQGMQVMVGDTAMGVLAPNSNQCIAISILYKRASYLATIAPGKEEDMPGYIDIIKFYIDKIREYGPTFSFDGKPCSVATSGSTSSSDSAKNKPGTKPSEQGSDTDTENKQTYANISHVVQSLPFDSNTFDFGKIDNFFSEFEKIQGSNNQLSGPKSDYEQNRDRAKRHLQHPETNVFKLGMDPSDLDSQLVQPAVSHYINFVEACIGAVNATGRAIRLFDSQFPQYFNNNSDDKNLIAAQIGTSSGGYALYERNLQAWQILKGKFAANVTNG